MAFMKLEKDNACRMCNADKTQESVSTQRIIVVVVVVIAIVRVVEVTVVVTHDIFSKNMNYILLNSKMLRP